MIKLKPCPLCSREVTITAYSPTDGYGGDWYAEIYCVCGLRLLNSTEKGLVTRWNKRVVVK